MTARSLLACELTPPGRGAVATVRVEGELQWLDVPPPLYRAVNGRPLATQPIDRLVFGHWGRESPEEVVACRVAADVVELHCHGGRAAARRILTDLETLGTEVEAPADYLRRCWPCVEAECHSALLRATTERTAALIAGQASLWRRQLELLQTSLTKNYESDWKGLASTVESWLMWSSFGLHLTQPWSVVLCGRPNVGKSSLINALTGYARSIVSPLPGTTRDVVTALVAFDGWPVELSDTAGLRTTTDEIEAEGVTRAESRLATADLKLLLLDASCELSREEESLLHRHADALVIAHKCDLPCKWEAATIPARRVSSVSGAGISELIDAVVSRLVPRVPPFETLIPLTPRLTADLQRLRAALNLEDADAAITIVGGLLARGG